MALNRDDIIDMFSLTNVPSTTIVEQFADEFVGAAPGAFLQLAGGTMTGAIDMGSHPISNINHLDFSGEVRVLNGAGDAEFRTGNAFTGSKRVQILTTGIDVVHAAGSFRIKTATFGAYSVAPVAQPAALTPADASVLSSGGAAVLSNSDSGVIDNMRTRIDELETKLTALGWIHV